MRVGRAVVAALILMALPARAAAASSSVTWTGAGIDHRWSRGANWAGLVPPEAGDDVIFPVGGVPLQSQQDLTPDIGLRSLVFDGAGYRVEGNAFHVDRGITMTAPSGTVTIATSVGVSDIEVTGPDAVVDITGSVTGLRKTGSGTLRLSSPDASLASPIEVAGGLLTMDPDPQFCSGYTQYRVLTGTLRGVGCGGYIEVDGGTLDVGTKGPDLNGQMVLKPGATLSLTLASPDTYGSIGLGTAGPGAVFDGARLDVHVRYQPAPGTVFGIVAGPNTHGLPVADRGEFAGLPEGAVFVADGVTFRIHYAGGGARLVVVAPVPAAAFDWYFAEGTVRPGFTEYLTIENLGVATRAVIRYQAADDTGLTVSLRDDTVALPANSRTTVDVGQLIAAQAYGPDGIGPPVLQGLNLGLVVSSDSPVVVERLLYFRADPALGAVVDGATDVVGSTAASPNFYFAEGTVRPGFVEYVTLQNPKDQDVTATLSFQAADDAGRRVPIHDLAVGVPASSRQTIRVNDVLASAGVVTPANVSVSGVATGPVLAERPMYFVNGPAGADSGTDVMGVSKPSPRALFAEGTVRTGFDEYLLIENPSGTATTATISFPATDDGGASVAVPALGLSLAGRSRTTVHVPDVAGRGPINVGANIEAGGPIVAERVMYFDADPGVGVSVNGATAEPGRSDPVRTVNLAEGTNRPGFAPYLTLLNPEDGTATVSVMFAASDVNGTPAVVPPFTAVVRPRSWSTVDLGRYLSIRVSGAVDFSLHVESDQPILVERPIYFSFPVTFETVVTIDGGTDSAGYSG